MAKVTDFGERVRDRLKLLGYWKNGKPDINRFSVEKGYIPSYVYRWAKGEIPRGPALIRLARDLEVSPDSLLGLSPDPSKRRPHPIAGGSSDSGTPPLPNLAEVLLLIRTWLRSLVWPLLLPPVTA